MTTSTMRSSHGERIEYVLELDDCKGDDSKGLYAVGTRKKFELGPRVSLIGRQ